MPFPKGKPRVRTLVYVVISIVAGIIGALCLTVYFRGLTVPSIILNLSLTQRIAARYHVRYRLESLRIGCLHSNCPGDIGFGATDLEINTPEPLRIHVNNTKLARRTPVTVVGLEIRSGNRPPAISIGDLQIAAGLGRVVADRLRIELVPNDGPSEIGSLEFDGTTKSVMARTIRVQSTTRPPLNIEGFGLEGWQRSPSDGWLLIDRVNARGMKLDLQGGSNVTSFCGQLPASDAIDQALGPFRPLLPLVRDVFTKLRGDLLRVALSMAVLILVLKVLSVLWLRRMLACLALSIIPAAAPFAVYFGFRETLVTKQLILAAGGVSVFLAITCFFLVYRKARKWYERFEPFVADLAAFAIVLPLLAYGYELPATPAPFAGLRLARIDVADIAGHSNDGVQLQIPQTSIQDLRLAFPGSGNDQIRLDLLSGQIRQLNMSAPLLRITANDMRIDKVSASYDTNRRELGDLSALLKLGGSVESSRFQRELQNIEFLRGLASRPNRLTFNADIRASAHPRDCTADYNVAAVVATAPVKFTALAVGDTQRVSIRTVRTLPDSRIQIAGGAGEVGLRANPGIRFRLEQVGGFFGTSQVSVAAMGISTSSRTAEITLGHSNIRQAKGWEIQFDNASITGSRPPNAVARPVELKTRIDNIRIEHPQDRASIQADIPAFETTISGQTTREAIPRSFVGTVAFRVLGANTSNDRLGTDRPISVSADIYKGLLDIPLQEVRIRESVVSDASLELPVRMKLSGRLSTLSPTVTAALNAEAVLPHFETMIASNRVSLNEVRSAGRVDVDGRGVSAVLNFETGWNSVELPSEPAAFCLNEISRLDMSATGRISKIAGIALPSFLNRPTATPCVSLPSPPEAFRFRLSGAIPRRAQGYAVQLEKENGAGIRVRNIETEVESLQIHDGHLEDIHTHANIAGIGNLEREGTLGLRNEIRRNATRFQLTSTLFNAGTPLLDATLSSAPARVTLDARQHVGADQILDPFKVFLPDLASRLDGIAPKARLARFHAEANVENSTLLDATALAQFEPGSLLSADSPHLKLDLSTAAGDPGPTFQINLGRRDGSQGTRRITTAIDVHGANVHAVFDQNVDSDVKGSISVEAEASVVGARAPSVNPILNNVLDVNAGLSRQFSNIAELLRSKEPPEPLSDVNGNLRLTQTAPGRPLLRIENDSLQFRFEAGSFDASWSAAGRTKVSGSAALESTLTLDEDHLLLDAVAPVKLSYSQEEGPVTQLDSNLPLQVAFAPRLKEALQKTEKLWNDDFYSKFWLNHSKFANLAFTPPVDLNEIAFGPVSLREVRFPEKPLQVAVGYSDALQVRLPISGRALFGGIDGGLEFSLTTSRANAALDTRLNLDFRGIQAGAVRTTRDGSQSPIVEDEFDGKVSLRVDGLTTDRDTLPILLAGKLSRNEIEKIGMSIQMNRSPEAADLRGVFQLSSQVQINLVNDVLNRIVKDLNLTAPPRALTYTDLSLRFDVDHGQVQTTDDLLKIGGLQLFSSNFADVKGEVRAHAGRPGERILLGDVIKMVSGFTGSGAQ